MILENWRTAVGWEGVYEVSDQGNVRSLDRTVVTRSGEVQHWKGRMRKISISGGYKQVSLYDHGRRKTVWVHNLVAEAFLGPRPPGLEVCHSDDDGTNATLANLRYDTHSANVLEGYVNRKHEYADPKVRQLRQTVARKKRYATDPEYRERVLQSMRNSRQRATLQEQAA